ncbi:MAG: FliH/SctL family protein [Dehalococcoidia bacterium]|nr:FliH/SctL family protein [Dehalococcoidia bacterium]
MDIVEGAQRRAEDLVRQAALEASGIREQARQSGHALGYQQGAAQARAELAASLALVQAVAAEGKAIRDDLQRRAEPEMVGMVIAALRTIVDERAEHEPELVEATVRRALERAGSQNVVRIRVHPQQVDGVVAYLARDRARPEPFEVLADGAIGLGGCIVDTEHGRVDARLDVQLDAVAQLLLDAMPQEAFPTPDPASEDEPAGPDSEVAQDAA